MSKHFKFLTSKDALLALSKLKQEKYSSIAHRLINTASNFKRELELSLKQ
jgi:hypothetical protein